MAISLENQESSDEIEPEYDFCSLKGVMRGKYASRYQERLRVIRLAEDVSSAFNDEGEVNEALREYLKWRQHGIATNPA